MADRRSKRERAGRRDCCPARRPALARLVIDLAVKWLDGGKRLVPAAFILPRSDPRPVHLCPECQGVEGCDVAQWADLIVTHTLNLGAQEVCQVFEARTVIRPGPLYSIEAAMEPEHEAGQLVVSWESRDGEARMWVMNVSWEPWGDVVADGFREFPWTCGRAAEPCSGSSARHATGSRATDGRRREGG
jgi:hypothetical protein